MTGADTKTNTFTDRETVMLSWAMQSLKTGPPEIDYEKLAGFAGMPDPDTASNAWAKIKEKLIANANQTLGSPVPKKTGGHKKTGGRKKAAPPDDEAPTPEKAVNPRKRALKKKEVEGEEASLKKKGRGAAKKSEGVVAGKEHDEPEDIKVDAPAEEAPALKTEDET